MNWLDTPLFVAYFGELVGHFTGLVAHSSEFIGHFARLVAHSSGLVGHYPVCCTLW
ncbi:hypothetical protein [Sporosarcina sp. E16_8]|uniref:hypothetical protein n=1 Tax=Sporosarcina sp. E16_8 TaxID=2789295 RepID=UPI001A91DCFC|nr:hypothetical protein [Sporosarcina sp. E16_8]MBO0588875.1 hypothetical protein [Sporosarcina sp. E16_8]